MKMFFAVNIRAVSAAVFFILAVWLAPVYAVPSTISYQGKLTDPGGVPVNGAVNMTFRIYSVSSGGTAVWTEAQPGVTVSNGHFSVALGSVTPIPRTVFELSPKYLSIQISPDPEMTPRIALQSVPYAYTAAGIENKLYESGGHIVMASGVNLGIGATPPGERLDVRGDAKLESAGSVQLKLIADTDNVTETDHPSILFSQDGGVVTTLLGYTGGGNTFQAINNYSGWGFNVKATNANVYLSDSAGNGILIDTGNNNRSDRYGLSIKNLDQTHLHVQDDGNVGLGNTQTPRSTLDLGDSVVEGQFRQLRLGDYYSVAETNYNNYVVMGINAYLSSSSISGTYNRFQPDWFGSAGASGMVIAQSAGGVGDLDYYGIVWGTDGTEKNFPADFTHVMRVQTNGNVGIRTTTPASALHVNGDVGVTNGDLSLPDLGNLTPSLFLGDNTFDDNVYMINFGATTGMQTGMGPYTTVRGVWARKGLGIHVNATDEFSVKSSSWTNLFGVQGGTGHVYIRGNVGMGTTNPANGLDILTEPRTGTHSTGKMLYVTGPMLTGQSYDGGVEFRHTNGTQGIGFGYNAIYATGSNADQELHLYSRGVSPLQLNEVGGGTVEVGNRMNFTGAAGNRMITFGVTGTAPPGGGTAGERLILWGLPGDPDYGMGIDSSTLWYTSAGAHKFYTNDSSVHTEQMRIASNGNVGIQTTNTFAELTVNGKLPGTAGSLVGALPHQVAIGLDAYDAIDRVKLWIGNYDNDGATIYPIYVEDENNYVDFYLRNSLTEGGKSIVYLRGNLGLGTETPANQLHVVASGPGTQAISEGISLGRTSAAPVDYAIQITSPGGASHIDFANGANEDFDARLILMGNDDLRVEGSNLTVAAPFTLDFQSTTRQMINLWSTSYGIGVQNGTQYYRSGDNFAWYRGGVHSITTFDPGGGTAQMVLNANGNLGIGTTQPIFGLYVNRTSALALALESSSTTGTWLSMGNTSVGGNWFQIISTGSGNGEGAGKLIFMRGNGIPNQVLGTPLITLDHATAFVGIGRTNPGTKLDVSGNGRFTFNGDESTGALHLDSGGNANLRLGATTNGSPHGWAGYSWIQSHGALPLYINRIGNTVYVYSFVNASDRRLKTNFQPVENTLDHLSAIHAVYYEWKKLEERTEDISGRHIGVIAQDVEEVFPDLVKTGPDGYKAVDYIGLTSVLLESIKELRLEKDREIERLREENKQILQRLSELEKRLGGF